MTEGVRYNGAFVAFGDEPPGWFRGWGCNDQWRSLHFWLGREAGE